MEDNHIEFDTDQQNMSTSQAFTSRTVFGQPEVPGMAAWLIRKGIISSESQARVLLLGIIIADFVLAGLVLYFFVLK